MRKFRGSTEFAQWRIPAWEVMSSGTGSSSPVGPFFQILLKATFFPVGCTDPFFVSHVVDGTQFLDDFNSKFEAQNLKLVPALHLAGDCDASPSQTATQGEK